MKKTILIFWGFILLFGCSSTDPIEQPVVVPEFSETNIVVEELSTYNILITKGVSPFTVLSKNENFASVIVNNNQITIHGIANGKTQITVIGKDGGTSMINVTVDLERYKDFKSDATLRFETPGIKQINNSDGEYIILQDKGQLFNSTKNKIGYGYLDGTAYNLVEWEGNNNIGIKSNPSIRDVFGVKALKYLEILKYEKDILWIVYNLEDGQEGLIVQKW